MSKFELARFTDFDRALLHVTALGMQWKRLVHGTCLLDLTKIQAFVIMWHYFSSQNEVQLFHVLFIY